MVWLYRSPIQGGRRGVISSLNDFYLPSLRVEEGAGERSGLKRQIKRAKSSVADPLVRDTDPDPSIIKQK
jgi:hypothetical protein